MAYADTGIHGVTLLVNEEAISLYGATVDYGSLLNFRVSVSLALDAPTAGTLTINIKATDPNGNTSTLASHKLVNPGDGFAFNIGTFGLDVLGAWAITVSLTSDVGGTQGISHIDTSLDVTEPGVVELNAGASYLIQVTTSNLSTSGGHPVQATLDTHIEVWWDDGMDPPFYYQGWTNRNIIAAGGAKVNGYGWSIPAAWAGTSGTIYVSVLDPNGNELTSASLAFNIK